MPADPDEHSLIETVLRHRPASGHHRPLAHPAAGPGDDAAVVAPGVVVTVDAMIEGVHWDARSSAGDVGFKLAAVNASDIGAMGCRPTWAVLALSLPAPADGAWVDAFARGLGQGLARWGASLVGGDTTASPGPIALSLTMAGAGISPVSRAGGRPGDLLWVTGSLGLAAAGFFDALPAGLAWLRRPDPPVAFGAALGLHGLATAMMDLSDGLARDLPRLCQASGVGARVRPEELPADPALAPLPPAVRLARQVAFGDDYQLLFASHPDAAPQVRALAAEHGVAVQPIGQLRRDPAVELVGAAWPAAAFDHFPSPAAQ